MTSSDSTINFFIACVFFPIVYLNKFALFVSELIKSTIGPLDGELTISTMAALASFLVGLPFLTALDGELPTPELAFFH